jgi:arsenite-transporting ATPase
LFDREIGDRETTLAPGLTGLEIDPDAEAERHISTVEANMRGLVSPAMYPEIQRQMKLARLAPGASEAALLERVAGLMGDAQQRYDLMIFDTAPTGHTLRLLSLPEAMAAWTEGLLKRRDRSNKLGEVLGRLGGARRADQGDELSYLDRPGEERAEGRDDRIREILLARRRKFHRARRLLLDREHCAFLLVLIPERLPILETRKALEILRQFRIPVEGLVVNRILPPEADGTFLANRRQQESSYLREIETVFSGVPRFSLPLMPHDVTGLDSLGAIAELMAEAA